MIVCWDGGVSDYCGGSLVANCQAAGFWAYWGRSRPPGCVVAEDHFTVVAVDGAGGYDGFCSCKRRRDGNVFVNGGGDAEN